MAVGKTWPFVEAQKAIAQANARAAGGDKRIILSTGYGPSGLPHLGTFAEVFRTTVIARAIDDVLDLPAGAESPVELVAFSDDYDGLRKVPGNVPNPEMLAAHLGQPLSAVPDPFGEAESFAAYNNARLCRFLDDFGFHYRFVSATQMYRSGTFNDALRQVLRHHAAIVRIVAKSVGEERAETYSPFLPLCPDSGQVLMAEVVGTDLEAATITYKQPRTGLEITTSILDGNCKLQWKADWGMRWFALGVDYEMYGKDLIDSARVSEKICRLLGAEPPAGMFYELFLDEEGKKISKSKGNGLSLEEWLRYGDDSSLAHFLMRRPQTVKGLGMNAIVAETDDFQANLGRIAKHRAQDKPILDEPALHICRILGAQADPTQVRHEVCPLAGVDTPAPLPVTYTMLLRLIDASGIVDPVLLLDYTAGVDAATKTDPELRRQTENLIAQALRWTGTQVGKQAGMQTSPAKESAPFDAAESAQLSKLAQALATETAAWNDPTAMQDFVRDVGKELGHDPLRTWYVLLYRVLFGRESGPRLGTFIVLCGKKLIADLLARGMRSGDSEFKP